MFVATHSGRERVLCVGHCVKWVVARADGDEGRKTDEMKTIQRAARMVVVRPHVLLFQSSRFSRLLDALRHDALLTLLRIYPRFVCPFMLGTSDRGARGEEGVLLRGLACQ